MPLRSATYADLLPASGVLAKAFFDGDILGRFLNPYLDKYPDDYYLFYLRFLREAYVTPDSHIVVTYDSSDHGKEHITGVAHWERKRASPASPTLYQTTLARLVAAYNAAESYFWPNRAAEPARLDDLTAAAVNMPSAYVGHRAENWHLGLVGVDPAAAKRGYGRALVGWGLARASEEGTAASVGTSKNRFLFYRRCGFDVLPPPEEESVLGDLPGTEGRWLLWWDNNDHGVAKVDDAVVRDH